MRYVYVLLATLGVCGCLVYQFVSLGTSVAHSVAAAPAFSPGTYTIGHAGALCAKEEVTALLAYRALRNSDEAALESLVGRGELKSLKSGDVVDAFVRDGEWAKVSVQSGSAIANDCWLPYKLLGLL